MASFLSFIPPSNSLANKTVIITGASAGIGKWNVKQFALLKPKKLFVLGRNATKTQAVIDAVRKDTGFDAIQFIQCDNASLTSVKNAANKFFELSGEDPELHLLVCNAGTSVGPNIPHEKPTEDGFELLWQSNYLSHFLLTELLLPTLKRTAEKERRAPGSVRIVNVSSMSHLNFTMDDIDIDLTKSYPVKDAMEASSQGPYGLSKFAQVADSKRLAQELSEYGIKVYSLHPGLVATEIWEKSGIDDPAALNIPLITEEQGSLTTLYVATSSDDLVLSNSGNYFDDGRLGEVNPRADRKELQIKLKEKSLEQVKSFLI
ncbi:hypothetical protein BJ742DRAFT_860792 [Cladochytrium replicatum]|nr:hypothetical protein BJ742DRAFT_860792 [Cladochytrium replicatum]